MKLLDKFKKKKKLKIDSSNQIFLLKQDGAQQLIETKNELPENYRISINGKHNTVIIPDTKILNCRLEINGDYNRTEIRGVDYPSSCWIAFEKNNNNRSIFIDHIKMMGENN